MRAIHMPPNFTLECKAGPLCRLVCNENGRCHTCMEASARIRVLLFTPGHYCFHLGGPVHIRAPALSTPSLLCPHLGAPVHTCSQALWTLCSATRRPTRRWIRCSRRSPGVNNAGVVHEEVWGCAVEGEHRSSIQLYTLLGYSTVPSFHPCVELLPDSP